MGKCDDESAACKQDVKDYSDANFARGTAEGKINRLSIDLDEARKAVAAALGTTAAGVTIALASGWTGIGGLVGGFIGVSGAITFAALAFRERDLRNKRDQARKDCDAERVKMKAAYDKSLTDCKDSDCRPSSSIAACP